MFIQLIMHFDKEQQIAMNKLVKPYKRFQSQGHVQKREWPTDVASLMFVACLVVEIIQRWFFAFVYPLWPCIKVKIIETKNENMCHA